MLCVTQASVLQYTFTFNNTKTIVNIRYNVNNNILTSKLTINNISIHSLRSFHLVKCHCRSVKSMDLMNFIKKNF